MHAASIPPPSPLDDEWKWNYYPETEAAWAAVMKACASACYRIDLEEYVLNADHAGLALMQLLMEKAKAGCHIRLLLDAFGSYRLAMSNWPEILAEAGVEVRFTNPITIQHWLGGRPMQSHHHRKIVVVDGMRAFIGGTCLYDSASQWANVMVEVQGKLAEAVQELTNHAWNSHSRPVQRRLQPVQAETRHSRLLIQSPTTKEHYFRDEMLRRIEQATTDIRLVSPQFIPDKTIRKTLEQALSRGVTVSMIVSRHAYKVTNLLAKHYANHFCHHGAAIYWFEPTLLQTKMLMVDHAWCAVGSANLDRISNQPVHDMMLTSTHIHCLQNTELLWRSYMRDSVQFQPDSRHDFGLLERLASIACLPLTYYG